MVLHFFQHKHRFRVLLRKPRLARDCTFISRPLFRNCRRNRPAASSLVNSANVLRYVALCGKLRAHSLTNFHIYLRIFNICQQTSPNTLEL